MIRAVLICLTLLWGSLCAAAPIGGVALMDKSNSTLKDRRSYVALDLALSQAVPFRVIYLDNPKRIVIEFFEVTWPEAPTDHMTPKRHLTAIDAGRTASGRSFLVMSLAAPLDLEQSDLRIDPNTQTARLYMTFTPTDEAVFASRLSQNNEDTSDTYQERDTDEGVQSAPLIVIDPGHGGTDSGAVEGGIHEADLMLILAQELRDQLIRTGVFDVVLTREEDYFVSLEERVSIAHVNDADAFISLHADKVTQGIAHGTTVYILADEASDAATQLLTERHAPNQVFSGMDFVGQDDVVVQALLDIARKDAQKRSAELARYALAGILTETGQVNNNPMRSGGFSVLKSAQIPSILIETGFLSTPEDLRNLTDDTWRSQFVKGLTNGLLGWYAQDEQDAALRMN